MNNADIKLLEDNGWTVECEGPFEIRSDDGSFATESAAELVLESLRREQRRAQRKTRKRIIMTQQEDYLMAYAYNRANMRVLLKALSEVPDLEDQDPEADNVLLADELIRAANNPETSLREMRRLAARTGLVRERSDLNGDRSKGHGTVVICTIDTPLEARSLDFGDGL